MRLALTPAVIAAPCANLTFAASRCQQCPAFKTGQGDSLTNPHPLPYIPASACSRPACAPTCSWAQTSLIPLTGGRSRTSRRKIVPIPPRGREGSCRRPLHGQSELRIALLWVGGRGRRLLRGRWPSRGSGSACRQS